LAELSVDDRLFIPAINRLDAYKRSRELVTIVSELPLDDETTVIHISARLRDRKWWIVAQRIPVEQNAAFIKRSSGKIERHVAEPPQDASRLFRLMKRAGKSFEFASLAATTELELQFVKRLYGKTD
jgi:deoxyribose-phosphate aldolase